MGLYYFKFKFPKELFASKAKHAGGESGLEG
jgi:hypothetical protein